MTKLFTQPNIIIFEKKEKIRKAAEKALAILKQKQNAKKELMIQAEKITLGIYQYII